MQKLLVIDDQKDNLMTIVAAINANIPNCKVLTALSGEEGIKITRKEQPDTILLDIIMPIMDGLEVCRRLKEDESTKHIPIIMITDIKTDSESRVRGLGLGADAFLSKPIDAIELSAQVNVMLRIKKVEDNLRTQRDNLEETVLERTNELRLANENLNKFGQIVSSSTDMLAFVDKNFIYLAANKAYLEAFSLSSDQLIDRTVTDVFGKEFFKTVIKPNADRCLAGELVNYKDWFDFPAYQQRYMDITYYPYYSEKNEITGFIVNGRNITKHKLAEDELKKSENLRSILLDNLPVITLIIKKHSREIVTCNKLAIDSGAVVGKTCYETLTNCDYSCPFCLAPALWETNEYQYIEKEYMGRYWECRWVPYTDELYMHYIVDITENKKAELKLSESQEKLELLFSQSLDGFFFMMLDESIEWNDQTDKDKIMDYVFAHHRITKFNDAMLTQYKATKEQFIGLTPNDFFAHDIDYGKSVLRKFFDAGKLKVETHERKMDGSSMIIEGDYTCMYDSENRIVGHFGIQREVTERKRSEQTQKVIYNISNAVITTDKLEELITRIKLELSAIIDTTNFYVALYDSITDTISLPFMADEKDQFTTFPAGKTLTYYVIKTQKSLLATKERLKKLEKSGEVERFGSDSKIWLGVPLKVEGKVTGMLAVQSYTNENAYNKSDMEMLEFVSEQISISIARKKAEQDIQIALYKATESDRLKSTFLATISHELRTPINAIIGFSSLVNEKTTFEKVLQYNKIISSSGNHLLNIVEDIFDITLIEAGESKLKKARVILNDIMKDIHEIVKAEQQNLNKNNLDMKLILDSAEQGILINTDPAKLKQILINLLKNALKFTHEGYIHFGYKINKEESKKHIEFFVKDTGIGIPKKKQKFIFDVFTRLEDFHSTTYGGTGLGLSIAKKLIEMLGGTIWLVSDPKSDSLFRGSTFYFTLPYDEVEPEDEIEVEKAEKLRKTTYSKGETILVVEDDQFNFEFLSIILEKPGARIFRALDGKEAIKFCKENPDIDLVLMDINMPIMNGYEATKEIKKLRPNLPVIAQTAYAIAGDKEKTIEAGCDDYISKPIKKDELLGKIEKLLSR